LSPIDPAFALYRGLTPDDRIREENLAKPPRGASIGTGGWIIGHLGMNPHATIAMSDQAFLVFDAFTDPAYWHNRDAARVSGLIASGRYRQLSHAAGLIVLARNE